MELEKVEVSVPEKDRLRLQEAVEVEVALALAERDDRVEVADLEKVSVPDSDSEAVRVNDVDKLSGQVMVLLGVELG